MTRPPRPSRPRPTSTGPSTDAPRDRTRIDPEAMGRRRRRFALFLTAAVAVTVIGLIAVATRGGDDGADRPEATGPTNTDAVSTDDGEGDETTTTVETTTTTEALRQASDEEPLRLLVAGDSLVGYLPLVLDEEFAGRPVEVIDAWQGSSGLVRPDYFDWPAELARLMDEHDPDVVVIGLGGNDTQPITLPDQVLAQDDPAWQDEYAIRVDQALDAIEAPGRTLWWIGLPLSDRDNLEAMRPMMTEAMQGQVEKRPWAHYVETLDVLAPDGVYAVHLPGPDGEPERVRADDGIHLSPAGMRRVVDSFIAQIEDERGIPPAEAAAPDSEPESGTDEATG